MKKFSLALAALLLLTGCGGGTSADQKSFISGNGIVTFIDKGSRHMAPNLSGATLVGSPYADHSVVRVVNVWASWCSPCRAEAPTLQALSKKYSNVQFIGILTRDTEANGRAFLRTYQITYPTLVDDAIIAGFARSLPANAIPTTLVIDKEGMVAGRISGEVTIASLSSLIEKVLDE